MDLNATSSVTVEATAENVSNEYFITPNPELAECTQMVLRSELEVRTPKSFFHTSNWVATTP